MEPSAAADLLGLLRPELLARLERVARLGGSLGAEVYLVGGTVRDLLLAAAEAGGSGDLDIVDLDLVVVGDALALARAVAKELGGEVMEHAAFLTADVIDPAGFHLDIATARSESYATPAALPSVRPANLAEDLGRRDFSINALAMRLGADGRPGEPIDPCGGLADLEPRVLRALHARSFLDDPTRALRGVRLELRLSFRLESDSEKWLGEAIAAGAFTRLSGSRLRHELELLLGDPRIAAAGIARLAELGLLAVLHPALAVPRGVAPELLQAALAQHAEHTSHGRASSPGSGHDSGHRPRLWLLLLMALAADLDRAAREELAERLLLAGEERRLLLGFADRLEAARPALAAGTRPHRVDEALEPLADEELLLLAARGGEPVRAWVRHYLLELRPFALAIRGADLLAAGAPAGPEVGRALKATRRARLDGEIGRDQELAFALGRLGELSLTSNHGRPRDPGERPS